MPNDQLTFFVDPDESQIALDAAILRGGSFEGSKKRIYNFFVQNKTLVDKAVFLKVEYAHCSRAFMANGVFWFCDCRPNGMTVKKELSTGAEYHFSWKNVAARITELIADGAYQHDDGL